MICICICIYIYIYIYIYILTQLKHRQVTRGAGALNVALTAGQPLALSDDNESVEVFFFLYVMCVDTLSICDVMCVYVMCVSYVCSKDSSKVALSDDNESVEVFICDVCRHTVHM